MSDLSKIECSQCGHRWGQLTQDVDDAQLGFLDLTCPHCRTAGVTFTVLGGGPMAAGAPPIDADNIQDFLQALDMSDVEVSDWEARFIESSLGRTSFSDKQMVVIRKLMTKYEHAL